jgi:hypothetical protein
VDQVLRSDFELFYEASKDPFHPTDNRDGKTTLNGAENILSWPSFKDKKEITILTQSIPDGVAGYTSVGALVLCQDQSDGCICRILSLNCVIEPLI